ncbi:MAG: metal ABC transporter permease [Rhodothermia bacterium]|nr:metal ABC transporter permease [Rhodothermia bacterium]NNL48454.1 metal ABC transporter permease [Acidimicrobiia bacterium]
MDGLFFHDFVRNALLASIIMGSVLAFLGVHVVERGIVFVDLALGQISMMGVAFAAYIEVDPTSVSIVFTLVGAFVLSLVKVRDVRLKQEAIIGIVYALTSAVTVLLISKSAHGESDISEVLFGSFFTVSDTGLVWLGIVFFAIALLHIVFRNKFFQLTEKFASEDVSDIGFFNVWNFLFYVSLGLAIVLGVRFAGVIPVFAFIVAPPVAAILMTRRQSLVIWLSVAVSVLGSFLGIYFSVQFDFPAGSSVVAMLGGLFLLASVARLFSSRPADSLPSESL